MPLVNPEPVQCPICGHMNKVDHITSDHDGQPVKCAQCGHPYLIKVHWLVQVVDNKGDVVNSPSRRKKR